jgi:hypothetical protein
VDGLQLHVLALGTATVLLIVLCWPLWLDSTPFPRVPFVRGWPALPTAANWLLLSGVGLAFVVLPSGVSRPWTARISLGLLGILVAGDQARLQPWVYQYLLEAMVLGFAPPRIQASLARLVIAAIYVHSGLSKLDHAFLHELGPVFLKTLLALGRGGTEGWPPALVRGSILAMPLGELAVGLLLLVPRTARLGVVGAWLMHVLLLGIVGPFGLDHSATVVGWNLAMLVEVPLLFWPRLAGRLSVQSWILGGGPAAWLILALVLAPLAERTGFWDSWPSFALYASHNERVDVRVPDDEVAFWPEAIRRFLVTTDEPGIWRMDLTNWSRFTRGVPPYPQARTGIGVALGLAEMGIGRRSFFARVLGRAEWWTGRRELIVEGGPDELRLATNRFFWNALPAHAAGRWGDRTAHLPGVAPLGSATKSRDRRGVAE